MSVDKQKRARDLNLSAVAIRVAGKVVELTELDQVELAAFKLQYPQIVLDPAKEAKPKPKKKKAADTEDAADQDQTQETPEE